MRIAKTLAIVALAGGCAASAPPPAPIDERVAQRTGRTMPPPPSYPRPFDGLRGEAASEAARQLFRNFFDRIVEIQEHRSGPGAPLVALTLFERPETTRFAGLCRVTAHDVGINFAPPPEEPPREAQSMRTITRYYAIGRVAPSPEPAGQPAACSSLPSAKGFFTAPSWEAALTGLQVYGDARIWAEQNNRAATFGCTALSDVCGSGRELFLTHLTPERIREVREVPCEAGRPGRGETCFLYIFGHVSGIFPPGDWTVNIKGPQRPLHVQITQSQPPVS